MADEATRAPRGRRGRPRTRLARRVSGAPDRRAPYGRRGALATFPRRPGLERSSAWIGEAGRVLVELRPDSVERVSTETQLPVLPLVAASADPDRSRFVARARLLAWIGLGWHLVEAAVAVGAGVVAAS